MIISHFNKKMDEIKFKRKNGLSFENLISKSLHSINLPKSNIEFLKF
jgi:hypothetical protein